MKSLSRVWRLGRIWVVLLRYNLDEIIFLAPWFTPFRLLRFLNPWYWMYRRKVSRGVRLRRALEDLGPILLKRAK